MEFPSQTTGFMARQGSRAGLAYARYSILIVPSEVRAARRAQVPELRRGQFLQQRRNDADRLRVEHNYNSVGYLASVNDVAAGTVYWTAVNNDAAGAILREDLGNGLSTIRTVDRASGNLEALTTCVVVAIGVQNLEFDWDLAGKLKVRRDLQANKREEFDYDGG